MPLKHMNRTERHSRQLNTKQIGTESKRSAACIFAHKHIYQVVNYHKCHKLPVSANTFYTTLKQDSE